MIKIERVQSSTLKTYISAIKLVLESDGYECSNKTFKLATLTSVCKNLNDVYNKNSITDQEGPA